MGSNLTIMSTTGVDSDIPIYEIWNNENPICEIGITDQKITVNFCEGIELQEIVLENLLDKMTIIWNELNDYQNRSDGSHHSLG